MLKRRNTKVVVSLNFHLIAAFCLKIQNENFKKLIILQTKMLELKYSFDLIGSLTPKRKKNHNFF